MRGTLSLVLVSSCVAVSPDWWIDDDSFDWDSLAEYFEGMEADDFSTLPHPPYPFTSDTIHPGGILPAIPSQCSRPLSLTAKSQYAEFLRKIADTGVVPSVLEAIHALGATRKKPEHRSINYAVDSFIRSLEVSDSTLKALLDLNQRGSRITEYDIDSYYHSHIRADDRDGRTLCNIYKWYFYVINPKAGQKISQLETVPIAGLRHRAIGAALRNLVIFELSRLNFVH
jgi:hypothetical protein